MIIFDQSEVSISLGSCISVGFIRTYTCRSIFQFLVELFHELSKALEVLSDPKAKAAYDAVLKAKEQARLRTQALDAKRKKFKQGRIRGF